MNGLFGSAYRLRPVALQLFGEFFDVVLKLRLGHHAVYETNAQRFVGIDFAPGSDQINRHGGADSARQTLGTAKARNNA